MNSYEIRDKLVEITNDLTDLLYKVRDLREAITHEIDLSESVILTLVPKKRRGRPIPTPSIEPIRSQDDLFHPPVLYDRMVECGFTVADIKSLFGDNSRIMGKIKYGGQRFTDIEAEKLTELFHLTEQERGVFFRKGLIKTDAQGHKDYSW